ncbi:MAG TPA: hypothetical protein DCL97_07440 [Dehalococcoidia bacterium]|nr:hypothetical protein [Dehalococcoidia bacterium]|tara:strand:- start:247 stop:429 length:183 start_codon:yes stop_codon:yes gene_type:complete
MGIVVLSMATVCFMFGLIAITRVDKVVEEDQQFGSSLGIFRKTWGQPIQNHECNTGVIKS